MQLVRDISCMTDLERYDEMFDYLRTVPAPEEQAGLLVFGRNDLLVAEAAGILIARSLADFVVISGGVGKDSGDLQEPEATYLERGLRQIHPTTDTPIYTEINATNGGENVRHSLALMDEEELAYQPSLITVAHATSARRLHEMARHEAAKRATPIADLRGVATDYGFTAQNPTDRKEAIAELLRLADWPAKGFLGPIVDLDENMVDFARCQFDIISS